MNLELFFGTWGRVGGNLVFIYAKSIERRGETGAGGGVDGRYTLTARFAPNY